VGVFCRDNCDRGFAFFMTESVCVGSNQNTIWGPVYVWAGNLGFFRNAEATLSAERFFPL
jgi:hypothetical protein